jgi:hypothetical protein
MRFTNQTVRHDDMNGPVLTGKAVGEIRLHSAGRLSGFTRLDSVSRCVVQSLDSHTWIYADDEAHRRDVVCHHPTRGQINWVKRHAARGCDIPQYDLLKHQVNESTTIICGDCGETRKP